MSAEQVFFSHFDRRFLTLPLNVQRAIQSRIDEMGLKLADYPHYRLVNSNRHRLRVGDYRVIYTYDLERNVIYLLAVGHRREIYR